jgi:threonine dehydrogenase-like Zn-dependent dehydrogenase
MRSLWFVHQGRVEWREVPAPQLSGVQEALVAPLAASSCDIDRYVVSNPSPFTRPFALGHNGVARVLEVGEHVETVKPGDVVAVAWHISCGRCDRCQRGLQAHCRESKPGSSYGMPTGEQWGGLFDDVVRVPYADAMLHLLPAGVDPVELVATSDNLTQAYATVAAHLKAGRSRILIFGWGINGLYAVAFARALGAEAVSYVDEDETNRATAIALGAAAFASPPEPELGRFDLLVDASADPRWLRRAFRLLEPEGMVECVAHLADVALPGWQWYGKGATLHCGVCSTAPHVAGVLESVVSRAVIPSRLWSERVAWDDDLPAAFVAHRRQLVAVRAT